MGYIPGSKPARDAKFKNDRKRISQYLTTPKTIYQKHNYKTNDEVKVYDLKNSESMRFNNMVGVVVSVKEYETSGRITVLLDVTDININHRAEIKPQNLMHVTIG